MVTQTGSGTRVRLSAGFVLLALGLGTLQAKASGPDETVLDATALVQLEQRADHAGAREQCYLYTELLHALTETAGRQMSAGQEQDVAATLQRIDGVVAKVESAAGKNAKRLKNAEELMEHTRHRLADMARVSTAAERDSMQQTLQRVERVHSGVLALVFAP